MNMNLVIFYATVSDDNITSFIYHHNCPQLLGYQYLDYCTLSTRATSKATHCNHKMINRSIGKLHLTCKFLFFNSISGSKRENVLKLKTSHFVLIALDRWTRTVSCPTAQKDNRPPVVVNDVAFLSTSGLVMSDVTLMSTLNRINNFFHH